MTDIPIIFSGQMVRALLEGRKTMTRRILKPQPERFLIDGNPAPISIIHVEGDRRPRVAVGRVITKQEVRYAPGDRLWVREGWRWNVDYHNTPAYRVDYPEDSEPPVPEAFFRWRSPIHMARKDSRLTLAVTAAKIERLQEITDDEAEAEGIESEAWDQAAGYRNYAKPEGWFCTWPDALKDPEAYVPASEIQQRSFRSLWESLHGADAWTTNPEVVALTFTVHKQNIDALPSAAAA